MSDRYHNDIAATVSESTYSSALSPTRYCDGRRIFCFMVVI